jgi:hypothetical protein
MTIESKDLIGFAIERAGALPTYWNILIAVITTILGLLASGKMVVQTRFTKSLLTCGFAMFAYSNLNAITQLNSQRDALCNLIGDQELRALVLSLRPPAAWKLTAFHLFIDVAVILMIWLVRWGGRDKAWKAKTA